jgi:type I restriction enzyme S subunit
MMLPFYHIPFVLRRHYLKRGELQKSGIPVYEQQHAITNCRTFRFYIGEEKYRGLKRFTVQPNDIIISCSGTIGKVSMITESDPVGIISQALLILRCNTDMILPRYLYYFLISATGFHSITSVSSGSVQVNIAKRAVIENIDIPYFSLDIQEKIVSVLTALDNKVKLNQKINENLERQVAAIFDMWFVNLSATNGNIPADWMEGTLGEVANITSGKRPPMKQVSPTQEVTIPLVGAASIMGYTNQALYNEPILVTGRVGTHGVIQRFQTPCWTSDNTLVIKSIYYEFVYQILQRIDYKNMNRGSTQPLITQTDLKNCHIMLPPTEWLQKFEALAGSLMAKYEANRIENMCLAKLRDELLPKLMSSEIDISTVQC